MRSILTLAILLFCVPLAVALPPSIGYVGAGVSYANDADGAVTGFHVAAGDVGGTTAVYVVAGDGGLVFLYQETNGCSGFQNGGACGPDALLLGASDPVGVPPGAWGQVGAAGGVAFDAIGGGIDGAYAQAQATYDDAWDTIAATWDSLW